MSDFSLRGPTLYPQVLVLGGCPAAWSFCKGGYSAELVSQYTCLMDVLNRAVPGFNSRDLVFWLNENNGFQDAHQQDRVKLVILQIGSGADAQSRGISGLGPDEYEVNLRKIILLLHHYHPSAGVIFLSPAMVNPKTSGRSQLELGYPPDMINEWTNDRLQLYAELGCRVCQELGVPAINCFQAFQKALDGGKTLHDLLYDGSQFTPHGYQVITDQLIPVLRKTYPHLKPEDMRESVPFYATYHRENDHRAIAYVQQVARHVQAGSPRVQLLEHTRKALTKRGYGAHMLP